MSHSPTVRRYRRVVAAGVIGAGVLVLALVSGSASAKNLASHNSKVSITIWDAWTNLSNTDAAKLSSEFHQLHPNINVNIIPGTTGNETPLQKITAALAGHATPNVSYMPGSWVAQVAQSSQVVDLTSAMHQPGWSWKQLYPAARAAVTVAGKVKGVPVGMDDVAVFYNKTLFKQAGVPFPQAGWTWDQYRADAKQLTNTGNGVFGVGIPGGGGNDTTWYTWPMIWQAGGSVLNANGKTVGFNRNGAGLKTLTLLHDMAQVDHSVYVDTTPGYAKLLQLFTSGRLAMYEGDTWQFPGIKQANVDYGVVPVPSWTAGGKHLTMADNQAWMVYDHGTQQNQATLQFLKWLTSPSQEAKWDVTIGLPALSPAAYKTATYQAYVKSTPGLDVFNAQLAHNGVAPPTTTQYNAIIEALGNAEAAAMLQGNANLSQLLSQAQKRADSALAKK